MRKLLKSLAKECPFTAVTASEYRAERTSDAFMNGLGNIHNSFSKTLHHVTFRYRSVLISFAVLRHGNVTLDHVVRTDGVHANRISYILKRRLPNVFQAGTLYHKNKLTFTTPRFRKKHRNHKNSPILQYLHFLNNTYWQHINTKYSVVILLGVRCLWRHNVSNWRFTF